MRTTGYRNDTLCEIFATIPRDDERRTSGVEIHSSRQIMQSNRLYSHGKHYLLAILDWDNNIALVRHGDEAKECSVSTYQHYRNAETELRRAGWTILEIPHLGMASFWTVNESRLKDKINEARANICRARAPHTQKYWDHRVTRNAAFRGMFHYFYVEPKRQLLHLDNT